MQKHGTAFVCSVAHPKKWSVAPYSDRSQGSTLTRAAHRHQEITMRIRPSAFVAASSLAVLAVSTSVWADTNFTNAPNGAHYRQGSVEPVSYTHLTLPTKA